MKVSRCRELLDSQDAQFVSAVRELQDHYAAAEVAELWKANSSDWAREQLVRYLDFPLDTYGQEPIIKRMFKHAESSGDHVGVAAFLVTFDRNVRRDWKATWDFANYYRGGSLERIELLKPPNNRMPLRKMETAHYYHGTYHFASRMPKNARLFKHRTRYYLRRRAWRYFRRLAHQQPQAYVPAACFALARYRDADLATGENILDSRGLLQIAFGEDASLSFSDTHAQLSVGAQISKLNPAPSFSALWKDESACLELVELLTRAQSHFVRRWAMLILKQDHAPRLKNLSLEQVLRLLRIKDPVVNELAAEILPAAASREELSLDQWLALLPDDNPGVAAQLCEIIGQRVDPTDVELSVAVELTLRADPSIAQLGLTFLQRSELARQAKLEHVRVLSQLATASCDVVAPRIVRFALVGIERIASARAGETSSKEECRAGLLAFFESPRESIRNAATEWLEAHAEQPLIAEDAVFWQRVLESPFDDLRLRLVSVLDKQLLASETARTQGDVWRQVLINIHRGGRLKPFVIERLREAIAASPQSNDASLRALSIAARSIRAPESRQALAAIVQLALQSEEVRNWLEREMPELKLKTVTQ